MTQPTPTIQSEDISEINYRGLVALKTKLGMDIMAQFTDQKAHMLHMAVGVAGEAIELLSSDSRENTLEECGDIEFFIEGLTINNILFTTRWDEYSLGTDRSKYKAINSPLELIPTFSCITILAGTILDLVKKYTIYNKQLDTVSLHAAWQAIHIHLEALYAYLGVTRTEVLKMNADKLNKRYKAGYSDKEAQERADKKEGE